MEGQMGEMLNAAALCGGGIILMSGTWHVKFCPKPYCIAGCCHLANLMAWSHSYFLC